MSIFGKKLQQIIYIGPTKIPVLFSKTKRSRKISITVKTDGTVRVTHPWFESANRIIKFVESKIGWIEDKVRFFKSRHPILSTKHTRSEYVEYSKAALVLVKSRLEYFNKHYNFEYKGVSIKNQKTRWGSCSSKKNLSFNYKVIFLPPKLQDYLVVHELCHLKEMNHSKRFWDLVGERVGDYKTLSKSLRIGDFK